MPRKQTVVGLAKSDSSRQSRRGLRRQGGDSRNLFEPLENRLLLSVVDPTSSKVATIAYTMTAWNDSGVVDGFIDYGQYSSNKVQQFTDKDGTHTSHSSADAHTLGDDPGWIAPWVNIGKMTTEAITTSQVTNGQGMVAMAQVGGVLDYVFSIRQTQPLPGGFPTATFNIPIKTEFDLSASVMGNPGFIMESGIASAYVEVCLSDGSQYLRKEAKVDWSVDQGKADAGGEAQDLQTAEFSNTIAFSPTTGASDYLSVVLNASGSSTVALLYAPNGKIDTSALANASAVEFDQLAFGQAQGVNAFNLSDYFEFVLGWDPSLPPPSTGKPGKPGLPIVTCDQPDLVDASDTGPSDSDNITGDLTPTFEGIALSGIKPLKSGQVILYSDGVEAGRGSVVNGRYFVTASADLPDGIHNFTVSAGANDILMGQRSTALMVTIDSNLPRGDVTTLTLGAGGFKAINFADGDGTGVSIKLTAGTAVLTFAGDGMDPIASSAGVTLGGTDLRILDVSLTGDTSKGKLTFTCKAGRGSDGQIDIGDMSSTGAVQSITGKGVNLTGDIDLGGAVQSLTLNDITGSQHSISWGGTSSDPGATVAFHNVTDVTLTSGAPLKSLAVAYWNDDSDAADVITAPSLAKLSAGADFAAGLDLSGVGVAAGKTTLGATTIKGRLTGGTWTIHGSTDALSVAGIDATWSAVIDAVVKSITIKSVTAGDIQAASIGSFKVTGDLDGASIRLTQPVVAGKPAIKALGSLSVSGTMSNSVIESDGQIGSVTVGRLIDSTVFVGVDTSRNAVGTLPDEVADFAAPAGLDALTIKGIRGMDVAFDNSFVAASRLGAVTILNLATGGAASGGLAGDSLQSKYTRKAGSATALTLKGPLSDPRLIEQVDGYIARLV